MHGWLSYPHRDALMDEAVVKAVHPGGRNVDVDLACDWVSDQISLGREDIVEEEGAEDHADLDSEEAADDSHVVAILANAEPKEGSRHGVDGDVREHEVRNERDRSVKVVEVCIEHPSVVQATATGELTDGVVPGEEDHGR